MSVTDKRDYRFDNIKGILILLVVFAHAMEVLTNGGIASNTVVSKVYSVIYSVHMPAFVFVSGYFSKSFHDRSSWAKKVLQSSLLPFIIANLFYWILASRQVSQFFYPQFAMWFILSLFFWKVMVYPFSRIKGAIIVAVMLSLYIGIINADKFLSLQRTFAFFPYFLAGYMTSKEAVDKLLKIKRIYFVILSFVFASVVILFTFVNKFNVGVFIMSFPYKNFEYTYTQGALFRIIALVLGFTGIFLLIGLASNKKSVFSKLGRNTITVYLIHPFFIRLYNFLKMPLFDSTIFVISISFVFAIAVCVLFGNRFVSKIYLNVMNKIGDLIIKNDEELSHARATE